MSQSVSTLSAPESSATSDLAATLKAAGDPLRLEILRLLARDSFGVMELSRIFEIKQSGMSHHLKVLANAGLVASRREGNSIFYRRALPSAGPHHELLNSLFVTLDGHSLSLLVQQRLGQIQQERASASQAFFADNATKFRAQQDLIASYPVYAEAVGEMLASLDTAKDGTALEVGPGEGEFLSQLAPRFERVVALDNSESMLEKARAFARQEALNNVEFLHGDSKLAVSRQLQVDCAVINMVLHHVPSPAEIFDDISQLLRPTGHLLVTDLCRHDQQWAREACGDMWLGFEPDDFSTWAGLAGLEEGQSQYIALRNGFQIQIRHFFKPPR
jgi:ArsR family transcriptional regulator